MAYFDALAKLVVLKKGIYWTYLNVTLNSSPAEGACALARKRQGAPQSNIRLRSCFATL